MGVSRQGYWSGLPFPSPGDLPDLGVEPKSLYWQENSLALSHLSEVKFYCSTPLPHSLSASSKEQKTKVIGYWKFKTFGSLEYNLM